MAAFEPVDLFTKPGFWRFNHDDVEFVARGNDSRYSILLDLAADIAAIDARCQKLLYDFMKHQGVFELDSVEVPEASTDDGGAASLRYSFVADADPHEFGYTYFDVWLSLRSPPLDRFWPIKFVVGFH